METPEFLRLYALRAQQLMWFLGAGASASAGAPTAGALIWDFKRTIFCAEQGVSLRACADVGDPRVRYRLQKYFESQLGVPTENDPDEYAYFFERAYPDERDRRRKLDVLLDGSKPSFGHEALAALMSADRVRVIWTTNFDRTVEDAAAKALGGTGRLSVATPDAPALARDLLSDERWPALVKLHGDFQSRRLKNTAEELRTQDSILRKTLVTACSRSGIVVCGYSGRDESIMRTFEEAIQEGGYPGGLFWCIRTNDPVLDAPRRLLDRARAEGIQAEFIEVGTFDELMADLLNMMPELACDVAAPPVRRAARLTLADVPSPGRSWPVVRLNAVPLISYPSIARRIACTIGGTSEVVAAIQEAGADVVAARRKQGVIAFGSDSEVRKAFGSHHITEFDLYAIEPRRLRYESAETGLLYDALARALGANRPLKVERRGRGGLIATVGSGADDQPIVRPLRAVVKELVGQTPGTSVKWREGLKLRLEFHFDQLWLVFDPTVRFDEPLPAHEVENAREFVRERLAGRYNSSWNGLIDAWALLISSDEREMRAFGCTTGVDAAFTAGRITAFGRRG